MITYMTATGHGFIGALLATQFTNPAIGIPLAILSHIAADLIPHWDFGTNEKKKGRKRVMYEAIGDVCISIIFPILLVAFIFPQTNLLYTFIMILMAQFFDWTTAPYYFFHINRPPFTWSYYLGKKYFDNRLDKPWGIVTQIATIGILFILVKTF